MSFHLSKVTTALAKPITEPIKATINVVAPNSSAASALSSAKIQTTFNSIVDKFKAATIASIAQPVKVVATNSPYIKNLAIVKTLTQPGISTKKAGRAVIGVGLNPLSGVTDYAGATINGHDYNLAGTRQIKRTASGAVSGAVGGFVAGGPYGAIAGAVAGGVAGAVDNRRGDNVAQNVAVGAVVGYAAGYAVTSYAAGGSGAAEAAAGAGGAGGAGSALSGAGALVKPVLGALLAGGGVAAAGYAGADSAAGGDASGSAGATQASMFGVSGPPLYIAAAGVALVAWFFIRR